jgi:hypothetical protein
MPRVLVTDDDGEVAWNERVTAADFDTEHFRHQLTTRLSWAVTDAQQIRARGSDEPDQAASGPQ